MAGTFQEMYCDPVNGSNLNAGSTNAAPLVTYASGNWDGTSLFTVASGNPVTDGVTTSMYVSVYVNGSTTTGYVGRVTAVSSTTITVSTSNKMGTAPTVQTGTATCVVGGYWKGPNATDGFPITLAASSLTDASFNPMRVNYKNSATYNITAAITTGATGPVRHQGMTSTPGDGGYAIFDGGTTGASYILITSNASRTSWTNIKFQNNGSTGTSAGIVVGGGPATFYQCVISNMIGAGVLQNTTNASSDFIECEFFNCNKNNAASTGGVMQSSTSVMSLRRCFIHNNTGTNTSGYVASGGGGNSIIDSTIIANNGLHAILTSVNAGVFHITNTDIYNNGTSATGNGIARAANNAVVYIENCNFVKNSGWGIDLGSTTISTTRAGYILNCGFGSGTQANTSGTIQNQGGMEDFNTITYTANTTPWNAPATGDFTLTGAAAGQAKFTGKGGFVETGNSMSGTISYPDVGSAQSPPTTRAWTF